MKITPPPTPHRAPTAVGGDLSGSTATPVVSGLGGTPLDTTTPTTGDILVFDGTNWAPVAPSSTSSPLTTKGDVFGYDTADARVPVGSNGQVLTADSTDAQGVSWQTPSSGSGAELDYAQFTSPVSITATTEGTANTLVTGASVAYDGSTVVMIQFYCPYITPASTNGASVIVQVNEGSTVLGYICSVLVPTGAQMNIPGNGFMRLTPSAASHTYSIRAFRGTGNGTVGAGAGGAGAYRPGFMRIIKA